MLYEGEGETPGIRNTLKVRGGGGDTWNHEYFKRERGRHQASRIL